jgi:hypothetical protein
MENAERGGLNMQIAQLDEIDIAFVVNLETFRELLKKLCGRKSRYWIASDPADALDSRSITVGFGCEGCSDGMNATYFRIPILNDEVPRRGTNRLVLLIAPSVIRAEDPGFRLEGCQITVTDILEDFQEFLAPVKGAIADLLRTAD